MQDAPEPANSRALRETVTITNTRYACALSRGHQFIDDADGGENDSGCDSLGPAGISQYMEQKMSPANASRQTKISKEQIEAIRAAIETSIGGIIAALLKKDAYSDIKLFGNGVDLIDVEAKVGLANAPLIDFHLKIAGPGPH